MSIDTPKEGEYMDWKKLSRKWLLSMLGVFILTVFLHWLGISWLLGFIIGLLFAEGVDNRAELIKLKKHLGMSVIQ
jgi:hypothetical protein